MEEMFSTWSVPRSYKRDEVWSLLQIVSSVLQAVKRGLELVKVLEAVSRERLVKTQQAGKDSAGAVVICELWN
jgi:hypothetical protein